MPMRFFFLCLIACGLIAGLACAAGTGKPQSEGKSPKSEMSDAELAKIRDGFDQRVEQAFEAMRGKPLVRAKKRPPLRPGRGNYVRAYSYSIIEFATRCFLLNEQIEAANAALRENAQHYLDNPKDINDRDSFHWHSEMVCRLIEFYGAKGTKAPGRMTLETERMALECVWQYARQFSKVADADVQRTRTWEIHGSENHHGQRITTLWHVAKLASESPAFRDRKYDDGLKPADHLAAWTEYFKVYCAERANKGLSIELGSDNYNTVWTKGFYNLYDFAKDPELRRRVGLFLDLYWAVWAQEQIGGVRGGGKTRIYQSGADRLAFRTRTKQLARFYFGMADSWAIASPILTALTSSYRPPLVVIDLALDVAGRGRYEIRQRPMGLAEPGHDAPPIYRMRTDTGGMNRYSWCTPAFIMGTLMLEPRPFEDWARINSQNRWHGVIFAGDPNARIVPQCQAKDGRVALNSQWSVQSKGTLICQKLKTSAKTGTMRVWFSKPGLTNRIEQDGWVFVEAPQGFAAVRVVSGKTAWEPSKHKVAQGKWLRCGDEWTPVIVEVACKTDFASYEGFRRAVAALPVAVKGNVLSYRGLGGETFTFRTNYSAPPSIDGKPVDYAPQMAFDSPFIRGEWNGGVVTITKGRRRHVLDFRPRSRRIRSKSGLKR